MTDKYPGWITTKDRENREIKAKNELNRAQKINKARMARVVSKKKMKDLGIEDTKEPDMDELDKLYVKNGLL